MSRKIFWGLIFLSLSLTSCHKSCHLPLNEQLSKQIFDLINELISSSDQYLQWTKLDSTYTTSNIYLISPTPTPTKKPTITPTHTPAQTSTSTPTNPPPTKAPIVRGNLQDLNPLAIIDGNLPWCVTKHDLYKYLIPRWGNAIAFMGNTDAFSIPQTLYEPAPEKYHIHPQDDFAISYDGKLIALSISYWGGGKGMLIVSEKPVNLDGPTCWK